MPADGAGSLRTTLDLLVGIAEQVQDQRPELHVFRWWQPDMALPAIYHWLTPSTTSRKDLCTETDDLRLTVSIAVDPRASVAQDAFQLEDYADLALDIYARELNRQRPLAQARARRTGLQMVSDRFGDAPVLSLELPIAVQLERTVEPTP